MAHGAMDTAVCTKCVKIFVQFASALDSET